MHVPIWTLFLSKSPQEEMPIRDLRTMDGQAIEHTRSNLLDMIYRYIHRQSWYHHFLLSGGEETVLFVGAASINGDTNTTANQIRDHLEFNEEKRDTLTTWSDTLNYLVDQSEKIGIMVMISGIVGSNTRRSLDPNEFQDFALSDEFAPLIFINGVDAKASQIFTLAHELAHIWLGNSSISNAPPNFMPKQRTELWCNQVAAERLVPKDSLRDTSKKYSPIDENIPNLARHYKVSTLVIVRRLLDIGLIESSEFFEYYNTEIRCEIKTSQSGRSGSNFHAT